MRKKLMFFFLFLAASFIPVYSQDADSLMEYEYEYEDTTEVDDNWDWDDFEDDEDTMDNGKDWNWRWDWDWDDFDKKDFFKSPTITLNYGLSKMNLERFSTSLADPGLLELKIGYTLEKAYGPADIIKYGYRYLYLSTHSADLRGADDDSLKLKTDMWRFGFGRAKGYGYKLGNAAIIPYYTYTLNWSRVDFKDSISNSTDYGTAELFDETFRFGTSAEGGIRFKIFSPLILEAGYERSVVFPRHLFWKWLGSAALEAAGQWALDEFIEKIMDSSPYAGPVINFVLKNALSYGIYELRQEKMNWPFKSAAPVSYDQFKFGITLVF